MRNITRIASVASAGRDISVGLAAMVFALAVPLFALAQTSSLDLHSTLPFDAKVRTGKLSNGLTYYIRQNVKPEHRAELRLIVKAGSVLEDNDQQGLAHFNEHMAFNGTKNFPHNTLESFLESNGARFGADLNAYTSFDETVYKLTLPTDNKPVLDSGMTILCDWAHNLTFDATEFEKERGVVGEEWRMRSGAQQRISDEQYPVLFHGSKYAERVPIGLKAVIDTAHLATIENFYHTWYRPDLMAVIAVGDFDPAKIEQQIRALFGPLQNPANERPRPDVPIAPHTETLVTVNTDKEMPQTTYSIYFKRALPPYSTVADYKHHLAIDLYDAMLNARFQELTQKGETPFAYAGAGDGRFLGDVQCYTLFALLRQDSVDAGIQGALRELYRAKTTGFTAGELDRAKKNLLSAMEKSFQEKAKTESSSYVREYASNFLTGEPSPGIDYEHALEQKWVPQITLQEVNGLSHELFDNTSRVIAFAAPDSKDFTPPNNDHLLGLLRSVEQEKLMAYEDKSLNMPLLATRPTSGSVTNETALPEIGVTVWTLSNGARVVLKPTEFKDDEILFAATAPGGSSVASDADYMSADNADNVVERSGLAQFDATSLSKMMAGKEVEVSPRISDLQESFSGHSSKKDLETLFQLTYLYVTQPRYDSLAAASDLSRTSAMLENRSKQPEAAFQDTLSVTMAQYHHRARPYTSKLLEEIHPATSYDYYRRLFGDGGNYTFYFVGNFDKTTLKPLVEEYLASLPSSSTHANWRDVGIHAPKGVITKSVKKGTDPKSIVQMVFTGDAKFTRENRIKLVAMAQAFEIKLREDIREDKSGVYYVSVRPSLEKYPRQQYRLTVGFGCNPDRVDELTAEVMRQIDTLTTKPMDMTYIERVQKIGKSEFETNLQKNSYWLGKLEDVYWNDLDPNSILKLTEAFNTLTPQMMMETAREYFNPKNYVQVVLYPENSNKKS